MAGGIGRETAEAVVGLRELWHTKNHPFYVEFHRGRSGSGRWRR